MLRWTQLIAVNHLISSYVLRTQCRKNPQAKLDPLVTSSSAVCMHLTRTQTRGSRGMASRDFVLEVDSGFAAQIDKWLKESGQLSTCACLEPFL